MVMALVSLTWEIKGQPNKLQPEAEAWNFSYNCKELQGFYKIDIKGKKDGCRQLLLLCPVLFVLQGFEAYVGVLLLTTAFVEVVSEWQLLFCGVLLVLMVDVNFTNTVCTLIVKSRFKAK